MAAVIQNRDSSVLRRMHLHGRMAFQLRLAFLAIQVMMSISSNQIKNCILHDM